MRSKITTAVILVHIVPTQVSAKLAHGLSQKDNESEHDETYTVQCENKHKHKRVERHDITVLVVL